MVKKFRRIILTLICLAFALELGLLASDTYFYLKYKSCKLNMNGYIISEIDNRINFSGMASR